MKVECDVTMHEIGERCRIDDHKGTIKYVGKLPDKEGKI